jgi:hypothetical protein
VFKRFRSGLFFPSEIINYRFEKKITTFLYFLILVLLSVLPSLIILLGESNLDYADKKVIREGFRTQEIPYKIENHQLLYTGENEEDYFIVNLTDSLNIVFTSSEEVNITVSPFSIDSYIILTKNKVLYQRSLTHMDLFEYNNYTTLKNMDFIGATNDDYEFWKTVFPIVNNQIDKFSLTTDLMNIGALVLVSLVSLLILVLLISFFQKLLIPFIRFSEVFQLMIYVLTPYVIGQLLGALFGISIMSFVGMIMTIIYASKLSRKLIQR